LGVFTLLGGVFFVAVGGKISYYLDIVDLLQKVVSLCKRRGFVFPNSEIYGGVQGFYDYGPLGVAMKDNIKRLWWQEMTWRHDNIVGIDGAIISHPRVWEASGHVRGFVDPLVECKKCRKRFRADEVKGSKCPACGGSLSKPRKFNILVETALGVVEGERRTAYLRGEACQNIYLNYQNILDSFHLKIPFGIVQIGKAFRNEITPKQFLFRQREFEQWDLQWFVNPKQMDKWFEFWQQERMKWYQSLITQPKKIRFRQHAKDELAHYAKKALDIEYQAPFGWKEWEGIHWRGDWDLSRHGEYSGKDFTYMDSESGEKFLPWIVETSGGVDRTFLFLLFDAYREKDKRIWLALDPRVAPYQVAVFPLLANKPELIKKAKEAYQALRQKYSVAWDDIGNIGKRYRRQDEVGTPWCVTVDFDSLKDQTVTIRDRDSMKQQRLTIDKLVGYFDNKLR